MHAWFRSQSQLREATDRSAPIGRLIRSVFLAENNGVEFSKNKINTAASRQIGRALVLVPGAGDYCRSPRRFSPPLKVRKDPVLPCLALLYFLDRFALGWGGMDALVSAALEEVCARLSVGLPVADLWPALSGAFQVAGLPPDLPVKRVLFARDRKSTRLNSSHPV